MVVHCVVFSAAVDGGKLMGYFNLPWFAWGSAEMNLGDTVEYNTLVRVTSPYDRLATAIIKLFVHHHVCSMVQFCGIIECIDYTSTERYWCFNGVSVPEIITVCQSPHLRI